MPSNDITLGYHRLMPLSYAVSLVYDYRDHAGLPTEHWIDGSINLYITDGCSGSALTVRSFGADQYNGRLIPDGPQRHCRAVLAGDGHGL